MATIINNPTPSATDDSSAGVIVGVVVVLLIIVLFFVFGLPYLRTTPAPSAPANENPGSSVNVQINPGIQDQPAPGNTSNPQP